MHTDTADQTNDRVTGEYDYGTLGALAIERKPEGFVIVFDHHTRGDDPTLQALIEQLTLMVGVERAYVFGFTNGVVFTLDRTRSSREVLAEVYELLQVQRPEHALMAVQACTGHVHAQLTLQNKRTEGQLVDLATRIKEVSGVAKVTMNNDDGVTITFNPVYATVESATDIAYDIALALGLHLPNGVTQAADQHRHDQAHPLAEFLTEVGFGYGG